MAPSQVALWQDADALALAALQLAEVGDKQDEQARADELAKWRKRWPKLGGYGDG